MRPSTLPLVLRDRQAPAPPTVTTGDSYRIDPAMRPRASTQFVDPWELRRRQRVVGLWRGGLVWPGSGPEALVKGVWSEIGAAGPDDGPDLGVYRHLRESVRRTGLRKQRSTHAIEQASSPVAPSLNVRRRTPWRTTATLVISGVRPIIGAGRSGEVSHRHARGRQFSISSSWAVRPRRARAEVGGDRVWSRSAPACRSGSSRFRPRVGRGNGADRDRQRTSRSRFPGSVR
jgi:hypothetical protein